MNQRYITATANDWQGIHIQSQLTLDLMIRKNPDQVWLLIGDRPVTVIRASDIAPGDVFLVSNYGKERYWTVHVFKDEQGQVVIR